MVKKGKKGGGENQSLENISTIKLGENENLQAVFADYIESRVTGEGVIHTFCLRNYDNPTKDATPLFRVYMSIPHFVRFAKMTEENIKKLVSLGLIELKEIEDESTIRKSNN